MKWLSGKLPVPEIKYFGEYDGQCYLLMTALKGYAAGTYDKVHEPHENTIKLLADGLKMIQSVDISDCPFAVSHDVKFKHAVHNIGDKFDNKLGFIENAREYWFEDKYFETPAKLHNWLLKNKLQSSQKQEEICFSHGDYGLPNIVIDGDNLTGIIDMSEGGISYKWHDIAICVRSIGYHSRTVDERNKLTELFFKYLGVTPDREKINYYIWLHRMFTMDIINNPKINIFDDII
jgi:kanamycin kinase/aminoglycoside 3'-phosphotransferase-3